MTSSRHPASQGRRDLSSAGSVANISPMRSKGLTPKPDAAKSWCPVHAIGASYKGWDCPKCPTDLAPNRALSREAGCAGADLTRPTPAIPKSRAGHDAEDGLARQLKIAGFTDFGTIDPATSPYASLMFVRGFAFGLYLDPRRGFAADFAFPAHRLLVEVDGGAHYATRKQGQHDTERRGLAASIGWTILPVTPEQVRDGSAVELVKRAIETAAARGKEAT